MNPTNSAQALSQLQKTQSGAQSSADILAAQKNQYGVQGAQDIVNGLRGAITNTTKLLTQVAPSVMGRTGQSLVTSAQANRQVQNEQQPIAQDLSQQSQQYNTANEDYNKAVQNASDAANMQYGDQQNKLSYMQNIYDTLFGREQAAQQAAAQKAQAAEQQRQFNENLALQKQQAAAKPPAGSGGLDLNHLLGGDQTGGDVVWNNKGGDNQFRDANGKGITAFQYAQQKGVGYRQLLSKMASSGDKNAATALKYVGDNGVFGSAPKALSGALNAVGARGNYV